MSELEIKIDILQHFDANTAWHYRIIPKHVSENQDVYYIDLEQDTDAIKMELELLGGKAVELIEKDASTITKALNQYYIRKHKSQKTSSVLEEEGFVDKIIEDAHDLGCSDIHIETFEQQKRVRFRLDGQLIQRYIIPGTEYSAIINKIKIMANMDISEKRLPQDGRILYEKNQLKFDIRVSSLPTMAGEKIVLRLLGSDASKLNIAKIGMTEMDLQHYMAAIQKPNGIILISGPTGSGKTTTLYATLGYLNAESQNILTIEDPIEYTLEGINQVQLKENIGLDFGKALRTFLRQDPDIIMVGEIRDEDTANMAIRAALTGHLVLSTIHTNSAWGIVSRLMDMNIPPFLLANTLNAVIAQRLLRKLCNYCKQPAPLERSVYSTVDTSIELPTSHFAARGCNECFQTGYSGRVAIYEVIPINQELARCIKGNLDASSILRQQGVKTLADNALNLISSGVTSMEEIVPILSISKS